MPAQERENTFEHTVRAWTVGDLRRALDGIADDVELVIETADEPGGRLTGDEQVIIAAEMGHDWVPADRACGDTEGRWVPARRLELVAEYPSGTYYRSNDAHTTAEPPRSAHAAAFIDATTEAQRQAGRALTAVTDENINRFAAHLAADRDTTPADAAQPGGTPARAAAAALAERLGADTVPDEAITAWADGYLTGHDRGNTDGYTQAYADYDRQLTVGLAQMLAGDPTVTDYAEGVRRHERQTAARARRDTADHPKPQADRAADAASTDGTGRPVIRSAYEAGRYRLSTDLDDTNSLPAGKPAELLSAEQAAWLSYVDAVERGDSTAAGAAAAKLATARDQLADAPAVHADADVDGW